MLPDRPGMGGIFNGSIGQGPDKRNEDEDESEHPEPELDPLWELEDNDIDPNMAVEKIDVPHSEEEVGAIEVNRHFKSPSSGRYKYFSKDNLIDHHKDQGQN